MGRAGRVGCVRPTLIVLGSSKCIKTSGRDAMMGHARTRNTRRSSVHDSARGMAKGAGSKKGALGRSLFRGTSPTISARALHSRPLHVTRTLASFSTFCIQSGRRPEADRTIRRPRCGGTAEHSAWQARPSSPRGQDGPARCPVDVAAEPSDEDPLLTPQLGAPRSEGCPSRVSSGARNRHDTEDRVICGDPLELLDGCAAAELEVLARRA